MPTVLELQRMLLDRLIAMDINVAESTTSCDHHSCNPNCGGGHLEDTSPVGRSEPAPKSADA